LFKNGFSLILICIAICAGFAFQIKGSFAQNLLSKPVMRVKNLSEIKVTATRSEKKIIDISAPVSRTERHEIVDGLPQLTLDEALTPIPGVFFQNQYNSAQDLRISIRGFGARSSFGVRGVKILVDGIPQTLPDGQTQVDPIDPGMVQSIEVLRGPSSSLYGNASGGVISINTVEGPKKGLESETHFELGQFGLEKYQFKFGGGSRQLNYRVYASHLNWEGYRDHSATENSLVDGKFRWKKSPDSDWTFIVRHFYSPKANDPGGLTEAQVEANQRGARPQNIIFDAGEEVKDTNFGLVYKRKLDSKQEISIRANLNRRVFLGKLPFTSGGIVKFERLAPGFGIRSLTNSKLLNRPWRLIAGVDLAFQRDDRKRFDNNNGTQGNKTLDRLESVYSIGPYLRSEWEWSPQVELIGGIRYDSVYFDVTDVFLSDGDQSDSQTFSEWSWTVGSVFHWNADTHFYANVATVFETPTTTELANDPTGGSGFNSDLQPQYSINYEIGLKVRPSAELSSNISLFYIQSRDELVPFEISSSPGRTFYKNTGESRRIGLEANTSYRFASWIKASFAYTFSDFKFTEFDDNGVDQSGHFIPGNPEHHLAINLDAFAQSGWFARGGIQHFSGFFVDNGNTVKNEAYTKSRFSMGHKADVEEFQWSVFLGLENLFNTKYQANTRINASNGRYFEPGPPLNFFGGISLKYHPFTKK
jgi:iron complex outermembrane recepter protein